MKDEAPVLRLFHPLSFLLRPYVSDCHHPRRREINPDEEQTAQAAA
jgi:hypothetical protein